MAKQELAEIKKAEQFYDSMAEIQDIANGLMVTDEQTDSLINSIKMAAAVKQVGQLITPPMVDMVMALQGSSLGFLTDKDSSGGYSPEVVHRCLVEATLYGIRWAGNEFNIISGKLYVAKNGCRRLVQEYPGLTDLEVNPSLPVMKGESAYVHYECKWKLKNQEQTMSRDIPIRVNKGMGPDAVLGKADRKIHYAIYQRISGSRLSLPEGEIDSIPTDEGHGLVGRSDLNDPQEDQAAGSASDASASPAKGELFPKDDDRPQGYDND